jgi:hypothetical protein
MSPDRTVPIPIKLHLPFQPSKRDRERREQRNSGSNLTTVIEGPEQDQQAALLLLQQQQQRPSASGSAQRPSSGGGGSATSSRSNAAALSAGDLQQQQPSSSSRGRCPVVHQIVAGGNSSIFLTRAPEEIPDVYTVNLLAKYVGLQEHLPGNGRGARACGFKKKQRQLFQRTCPRRVCPTVVPHLSTAG